MIDVALFLLAVLLLIVVEVLATATFHESAHYLTARLWTSEINYVFRLRYVPASVNFHTPIRMPDLGIRLSAIAPLLYGGLLAGLIYVAVPLATPWKVLLLLPFAAAMILSPSDLLGVFFPQRFREIASDSERLGVMESVHLLFVEFKRSLR